jgi:hypothetical protein
LGGVHRSKALHAPPTFDTKRTESNQK